MATPRRRSSRIKSTSTQSQNQNTPLSKLSSLLERDESPANGQVSTIDTLISSPTAPPNTVIALNRFNNMSSAIRTPQTASRIYPSHEEMHPSHAHPSTVKPSVSRCLQPQIAMTPSKSTGGTLTQDSPARPLGGLPKHMISPSFDFSFERPESHLSAEAQKIMDSVRGEAAKIKAQMMEERNKQVEKDGETHQLYGVGGRKINKAKGKSGRYSDVHRQEFKKMDSIADHVSTWKNKIPENISSLKRSPSKAGFDQSQKPLQKTKSFKSFGLLETRERLENTSPTKRVKKHHTDDTSAARPVSRDTNSSLQATPVKIPTKTGLPSAVTTPTKASLARSASVKSMKTSMIPSLSRSASTTTLNSPAMPKTEGSNKYASSLARFGNMKSILHRSQPKFSNDPNKIAAGTHLPLPQGLMDVKKSLPDTPSADIQRIPTTKRVGFTLTPSSKSCQNLAAASPSPSKIPTAHPQQQQPEVSTSPRITTDPVIYPDLANSPNITKRTKLPRASTPGDFTFRAEKPISFSPIKGTGGVTSPGSTIRHVRPSGVPTHVSSFDALPPIPHGMPNKKRSRPASDTESEDVENVDPMDTDEDGPRAKKQRMNDSFEGAKLGSALSPMKSGNVASGGGGGSKIPKSGGGGGVRMKGRKGISLGRLNMLARPKRY